MALNEEKSTPTPTSKKKKKRNPKNPKPKRRDAWTAVSGTPKEEAKRKYVELAESLVGGEEGGEGTAGAGPGPTKAAAGRGSGARGGTRFGPVFSVPGGGEDDDGGRGGDDDEDDDDDEDGVVMVRDVFLLLQFIIFSLRESLRPQAEEN